MKTAQLFFTRETLAGLSGFAMLATFAGSATTGPRAFILLAIALAALVFFDEPKKNAKILLPGGRAIDSIVHS